MIRKLRIKFTMMAMASLFLVLAVIVAGINALNYRGIIREADGILSILLENDGTFPRMDALKGDGKKGKEKEKGMGMGGPMSPETRYEIRHFSVRLGKDGKVVSADTGKISAVDTQEAIAYAEDVFAGGSQEGFVGIYRYRQQKDGDGALVVFVDCRRSLSTFRDFLATSCGISLLGMAAVLFLILLFSGRIIGPVSESYEKQKRFITDAGHEIKTPLAIIEADAEVLVMDMGENEWLSDIKRQAERLADLTDSLISLSRMEEGKEQLQMVDFPISDLVAETAQSFQTMAQMQGKKFASEICPMLFMRGDESAIQRLVTILLDNALKYSGENGEISLTLEKQGKTVRLSVYNTAENVERESLPHLFERFYRADSSRNSSTGGYGLGLSIAYAIVSAHKGKIAASTKDGKSMLITVSLPG